MTLEYTFDCEICTEQGSILPGMGDFYGIGTSLYRADHGCLFDFVCSDVGFNVVVMRFKIF